LAAPTPSLSVAASPGVAIDTVVLGLFFAQTAIALDVRFPAQWVKSALVFVPSEPQ
jgi:hypothetical protein